MDNADDALPQPQPAHQKPASPFKFLKPLALLVAVILVALVAGTGGYWLGTRSSQRATPESANVYVCRGGSFFHIKIQTPDQWTCEPYQYGLILRSELFTVVRGHLKPDREGQVKPGHLR